MIIAVYWHALFLLYEVWGFWLSLQDPRVLAASGAIANVPVLFGTNADEGSTFIPCDSTLSAGEYLGCLVQSYVHISLSLRSLWTCLLPC
jgi:hypothetical protein